MEGQQRATLVQIRSTFCQLTFFPLTKSCFQRLDEFVRHILSAEEEVRSTPNRFSQLVPFNDLDESYLTASI